jgi:deoxyxylulose-5-phosphate synthase
VLEVLSARGLTVPTRVLGIPDRVWDHASQARLREMAGLSPHAIAEAASALLRDFKAADRDVRSPLVATTA